MKTNQVRHAIQYRVLSEFRVMQFFRRTSRFAAMQSCIGVAASAFSFVAGCVLIMTTLTGCVSSPSVDSFLLANMPGTGTFSPSYSVLREGDVVQVSFEGSTNLNATLRIPFDGTINLQFVGKVKAAGKTTLQLEALLAVLYETQIKPTEISVTVVSPAAVVYVAGAVLRPGKVSLDRPLTLLDAVMEVGGVDHNRAKMSDVTLLRIEDGRRRSYKLNLKRAINGKDGDIIYLRPFDIIYVHERTFNF